MNSCEGMKITLDFMATCLSPLHEVFSVVLIGKGTVGSEGQRTRSGSSRYLGHVSDPFDGVLRAAHLGGRAAPVEVHLLGYVLGAIGHHHVHGGGQADHH